MNAVYDKDVFSSYSPVTRNFSCLKLSMSCYVFCPVLFSGFSNGCLNLCGFYTHFLMSSEGGLFWNAVLDWLSEVSEY